MDDFTTTARPEFLHVIADLRMAYDASQSFRPANERRHVREAALTLIKVSLDLLVQARPEREIDGLTNELLDAVLAEVGAYSTELEEKRSRTNEN